MAVDDLVKKITFEAETSAARRKIAELNREINVLVSSGQKESSRYKDVLTSLIKLTQWQERRLALVKKQEIVEKSQLELARKLANIKSKRKEGVSERVRQGFDVIGGTTRFLMNPITAATQAISGSVNKSFGEFFETRQAELSSVEEQYAANQEALSKFEGKEKLTPKERAEKEALQKEQKDLEKKSSDIKSSMSKATIAQAAFNTAAKAASYLGKAFNKLSDGVKEAVTAMIDFKTGVATYNTQTSLITNSAAREQQMKYGLSSSQNWAFTQAKSMLNIQSDEDLMFMNAEQRERLLSYMEKYSNWYDELEASGVLNSIQEMQLEFNELKQELAMEFLQWVAENKDTIMACIRGIFEFIKFIANIIMSILSLIPGGKGKTYDLYNAANASDTYTSNTNNKNTNITINATTTNNATGILSSQDALDRYNEENWSNLAKQIVGAIGG